MTSHIAYDREYIKQKPHEIVAHYLGQGRTEGVRLLWDCPGCGSAGKFAVNTTLNKGGCWKDGCPAGIYGDSFDLVGYFEGFEATRELPRAVEQAARILGLEEAPNGQGSSTHSPHSAQKAPREPRAEPFDLQERLALCDKVYRRLMELCPLESRDARFWAERGITRKTMNAAGFGSITAQRARYVKERLEEEFGRKALLDVPGFSEKHDNLVFTLTGDYTLIPYYDSQNRITTIEGRAIQGTVPSMGKYVSLRGAGNHLYVFPGTNPSELEAITEGPIGAIAAAQYGFRVGAIQGCERYRASRDPGAPDGEPAGPLLELVPADFGGCTVPYIPDSDDPPNEQVLAAAPKAAYHLAAPQNGVPALCWLPTGMDLDEWLISLEPAEREHRFRELLASAQPRSHNEEHTGASEVVKNGHRYAPTASAPGVDSTQKPAPIPAAPPPAQAFGQNHTFSQDHASGETPAAEQHTNEYATDEPAAGDQEAAAHDKGQLFEVPDTSPDQTNQTMFVRNENFLPAPEHLTGPSDTAPKPPNESTGEEPGYTAAGGKQNGAKDPQHTAAEASSDLRHQRHHEQEPYEDSLYQEYAHDQKPHEDGYAENPEEDPGNYESIDYSGVHKQTEDKDDTGVYEEEDYVDEHRDLPTDPHTNGDGHSHEQPTQSSTKEPRRSAKDLQLTIFEASMDSSTTAPADAGPQPATPKGAEPRKLSSAEKLRHKVYLQLLQSCPPKEEHLAALHHQGVDPDFAALAGLGSLDEERARGVAAALEEQFGAKRLLVVPGFAQSGTGRIEISLRGEYLLAPCLDSEKHVLALEALVVDPETGEVHAEEGVPLTGAGSHLYLHPRFEPNQIEGFCEGILGALLTAQEGVAVAAISGFRRYKARSGPSPGTQKPDAVLPQLEGVDFQGRRLAHVPRIVPGEENSRYAEVHNAADWLIVRQNGVAAIAGVPQGDSPQPATNGAAQTAPQAHHTEPISLARTIQALPEKERQPRLRKAFPRSPSREEEIEQEPKKPSKPGAPITTAGINTRIAGGIVTTLVAATVALVVYWLLGLLEGFSSYVGTTPDGMAMMDGGTLGRIRELAGAWPLQVLYSSSIDTALIAGALATIPVMKTYNDRARLKEQAELDAGTPWTLHQRPVRNPLRVGARRRKQLRRAFAGPLLGGPFKQQLRECWPAPHEAGSRWQRGWLLVERSGRLTGRALWVLAHRSYLLCRLYQPLRPSDLAVMGLWWMVWFVGVWAIISLGGSTAAPVIETVAVAGEGSSVDGYVTTTSRVTIGLLEEPLRGALWISTAGLLWGFLHRLGIRTEEVRLLSGKIND